MVVFLIYVVNLGDVANKLAVVLVGWGVRVLDVCLLHCRYFEEEVFVFVEGVLTGVDV